jgi:miniconductance mechanosensitive channel
MSFEGFVNEYFYWLLPVVVLTAFLLFRGVKFVLARAAYRLALRSETIYDDLVVDRRQRFRFAWIVPILLFYFAAESIHLEYQFFIDTLLVLTIWLSIDLIAGLLNGINDIYKHNPRYTGVSVAGYIGLLKVIIVVAGIVLTISYFFEIEPVALLSGIGAWLAVLLLICIQISTQKLIKEGDSVDVPAFNASGTISNIDLQTVTVQNYDNTLTVIPTVKIVDTGFKNYRTMIESGSRRIKRAILLDATTIQFVDPPMVEKLGQVDFLKNFLGEVGEQSLGSITNLQLFIQYTETYLRGRKEVRQRRFPFIVRLLAPTPEGLPLEIYLFVKAASWEKYEAIQAEIFIHLLATLPYFGLSVYQSG